MITRRCATAAVAVARLAQRHCAATVTAADPAGASGAPTGQATPAQAPMSAVRAPAKEAKPVRPIDAAQLTKITTGLTNVVAAHEALLKAQSDSPDPAAPSADVAARNLESHCGALAPMARSSSGFVDPALVRSALAAAAVCPNPTKYKRTFHSLLVWVLQSGALSPLEGLRAFNEAHGVVHNPAAILPSVVNLVPQLDLDGTVATMHAVPPHFKPLCTALTQHLVTLQGGVETPAAAVEALAAIGHLKAPCPATSFFADVLARAVPVQPPTDAATIDTAPKEESDADGATAAQGTDAEPLLITDPLQLRQVVAALEAHKVRSRRPLHAAVAAAVAGTVDASPRDCLRLGVAVAQIAQRLPTSVAGTVATERVLPALPKLTDKEFMALFASSGLLRVAPALADAVATRAMDLVPQVPPARLVASLRGVSNSSQFPEVFAAFVPPLGKHLGEFSLIDQLHVLHLCAAATTPRLMPSDTTVVPVGSTGLSPGTKEALEAQVLLPLLGKIGTALSAGSIPVGYLPRAVAAAGQLHQNGAAAELARVSYTALVNALALRLKEIEDFGAAAECLVPGVDDTVSRSTLDGIARTAENGKLPVAVVRRLCGRMQRFGLTSDSLGRRILASASKTIPSPQSAAAVIHVVQGIASPALAPNVRTFAQRTLLAALLGTPPEHLSSEQRRIALTRLLSVGVDAEALASALRHGPAPDIADDPELYLVWHCARAVVLGGAASAPVETVGDVNEAHDDLRSHEAFAAATLAPLLEHCPASVLRFTPLLLAYLPGEDHTAFTAAVLSRAAVVAQSQPQSAVAVILTALRHGPADAADAPIASFVAATEALPPAQRLEVWEHLHMVNQSESAMKEVEEDGQRPRSTRSAFVAEIAPALAATAQTLPLLQALRLSRSDSEDGPITQAIIARLLSHAEAASLVDSLAFLSELSAPVAGVVVAISAEHLTFDAAIRALMAVSGIKNIGSTTLGLLASRIDALSATAPPSSRDFFVTVCDRLSHIPEVQRLRAKMLDVDSIMDAATLSVFMHSHSAQEIRPVATEVLARYDAVLPTLTFEQLMTVPQMLFGRSLCSCARLSVWWEYYLAAAQRAGLGRVFVPETEVGEGSTEAASSEKAQADDEEIPVVDAGEAALEAESTRLAEVESAFLRGLRNCVTQTKLFPKADSVSLAQWVLQASSGPQEATTMTLASDGTVAPPPEPVHLSLGFHLKLLTLYSSEHLDGGRDIAEATFRRLELSGRFDATAFVAVTVAVSKLRFWTEEARGYIAKHLTVYLEALDVEHFIAVFKAITTDEGLREQFGPRLLARLSVVVPFLQPNALDTPMVALHCFSDVAVVEEAVDVIAAAFVKEQHRARRSTALRMLELLAHFQVHDPEAIEAALGRLRGGNIHRLDPRMAASLLHCMAECGVREEATAIALLRHCEDSLQAMPIGSLVSLAHGAAELGLRYTDLVHKVFQRMAFARDSLRREPVLLKLCTAACEEYRDQLPPSVGRVYLKRKRRVCAAGQAEHRRRLVEAGLLPDLERA